MLKNTFAYCESEITRRKRFLAAIILALLVSALPLILSIERWLETLILLSICLSILSLLFIVMAYFLFKSLRQRQVHLDETRLVMKSRGSIIQEISWNSIKKVKKRLHPSGTLRSIEVYSSSKRPLLLSGFEDMSSIMHLIEHYLSNETSVETITSKFDWENPVLLYSVLVTAGIFFGTLYHHMGRDVFIHPIMPVFKLVWGLFFLLYGPISRSKPSLRKWDILLGIYFIGRALFDLFGR